MFVIFWVYHLLCDVFGIFHQYDKIFNFSKRTYRPICSLAVCEIHFREEDLTRQDDGTCTRKLFSKPTRNIPKKNPLLVSPRKSPKKRVFKEKNKYGSFGAVKNAIRNLERQSSYFNSTYKLFTVIWGLNRSFMGHLPGDRWATSHLDDILICLVLCRLRSCGS